MKEKYEGEALSKYPRDSYYLATKFYAAANTDIKTVFEEQLKRLRTDYLGYLLEQKKAGRIRYLGFSSHAAPDTLERFLDWYDGFDMALIQVNYLDWTLLDAKRQYEILVSHEISVWVMEPLKGGRLATLNQRAADILKAAALERSLSSWGFRFLMGLDHVHTVLSGMSTVEQVLDNCTTFENLNPLSETDQNNA